MEYPAVSLADCCVIKPPKAEARVLLKPDDLVSFVPMDSLGINKKVLKLEKTRALADVSGSYTYFAENDVLLAKITPCFENGKLGIATGLTNGIGFGSSEFIVFRPNEHLNSEYLYYFLNQPSFRDAGQAVMTGAVGHKRVPKDFIQATQIPLPPIPEQQRIVAILDQAFADIEKARANAEQNLKNARELFDSYLDGICSSKSLLPSRLIGDVCSLYQGIAINNKSKHLLVEKSSLPLLRIKDLKNNREEQYVSEEGYPVNSRVFEEDILYTRTGSLGLVFRGRNGVLHNNSFKVVPNDSIDKNYLFWWLQHASFKKAIMRLALKAAQPDITHAIFKIQKIEIPLLDDQKNWVENIERQKIITDDLAVIYKSKLLALDKLKKSLLQKAFSGELTKDKGIAA